MTVKSDEMEKKVSAVFPDKYVYDKTNWLRQRCWLIFFAINIKKWKIYGN